MALRVSLLFYRLVGSLSVVELVAGGGIQLEGRNGSWSPRRDS